MLATLFPSGSAAKNIEDRLADIKERRLVIDEEARTGVIDSLVKEILEEYAKDPNFQRLPMKGAREK